jgi:hypothetical protein
MKYSCIICDYNTNDSCNWSRHTKSKKHSKKVEDNANLKKSLTDNKTLATCHPNVIPMSSQCHPNVIPVSSSRQINKNHRLSDEDMPNDAKFICSNCDTYFSSRQSLSRHKKNTCSKNKTNTELLEQNAELLKINAELLAKQNDDLKNDKEYLKSLVQNASNIASDVVKYSSTALTFVAQNFANAQVLEAMPDYSAIKEDCGKRELAISICEFYKDNTLIRYLSQFLLDKYKKTNPEEQSIWNSDTTRLSYLIRKIVDNTPIWTIDKKGVGFKECVITPLFSYILKELFKFMSNPNNLQYSNTIESCTLLIQDIQSSVICDEMLRFLAPHFHLSRAKDKCLAITAKNEV